MLRFIRKIGAAAAILFAASAIAGHADVRAFNEAVKKGDYATAAAAAKEVWPTLDKTGPDIAIIAAEFGFASLVSGDSASTREYAQFLMDQGATLPTPDRTPATSRVLFAVSNYQIGNKPEQLAALRDALNARQQAGGFDMISVLAWELLYNSAWANAEYGDAETDARTAAEYFKRMPGITGGRRRSAEVIAEAAAFLQQRGRATQGRNQLYSNMADLHDQIVADINAAPTDAARVQLWASKWRAEAWSYAIASYLQSSYEQVGSIISTKLKERALERVMYPPVAEDPATSNLPICEGDFEGRAMRYPQSKEFMGLVGAVIARMETAADGKVTKVEVLATVPSRGFDDSVRKTLETWTYKPARGSSTQACRLNSRNHIYRVTFSVG